MNPVSPYSATSTTTKPKKPSQHVSPPPKKKLKIKNPHQPPNSPQLRLPPFRLLSIVFIYTCPATSSIKQRMLYASSLRAMLYVAPQLGLSVTKKLETCDVDELSLRFLWREVHGEAQTMDESKKGFARPRGPPKRNVKG